MSSYAARRRRYGLSDNPLRTTNSSAVLTRIKSRNLSPVSTYYKPLLRTFSKRDDLQKINKVSLFLKKKRKTNLIFFSFLFIMSFNFIIR